MEFVWGPHIRWGFLEMTQEPPPLLGTETEYLRGMHSSQLCKPYDGQ